SVYRLGNLTILEKKLNKEAGNLKFNEKKSLYCQSNSKITLSLKEHYEEWNENNLSVRQKELAKDAKAIWRIQELK
ncbi:MAG: HNH endonuclease family protein, partial [Bacteroidetes bacterium]|nr:HNH endonuclease family protein [Bacteroidota bacterium]